MVEICAAEVRLVVGSCFAVARGILPLSELREALDAKSVVDLSEFVAPAAGVAWQPLFACLEGLVLHDQHFDAKKVRGHLVRQI